MDYEKEYKEALERARKLGTREMPIDPTHSIQEQIFPELRESEDEKARKEVIERLKWELQGAEDQDAAGGCSRQKDIAMFKRCISWLEKQKPVETPQWMIDFLYGYRKQIGHSMDYDEIKEVDGRILTFSDG